MILFIVCTEKNDLTTTGEIKDTYTTDYVIINDFWNQIDVPVADILSLASDKMSNLYISTQNNGIYRSNQNKIFRRFRFDMVHCRYILYAKLFSQVIFYAWIRRSVRSRELHDESSGGLYKSTNTIQHVLE